MGESNRLTNKIDLKPGLVVTQSGEKVLTLESWWPRTLDAPSPEGKERLIVSIEPSQGHLEDLGIDPGIFGILGFDGR